MIQAKVEKEITGRQWGSLQSGLGISRRNRLIFSWCVACRARQAEPHHGWLAVKIWWGHFHCHHRVCDIPADSIAVDLPNPWMWLSPTWELGPVEKDQDWIPTTGWSLVLLAQIKNKDYVLLQWMQNPALWWDWSRKKFLHHRKMVAKRPQNAGKGH